MSLLPNCTIGPPTFTHRSHRSIVPKIEPSPRWNSPAMSSSVGPDTMVVTNFEVCMLPQIVYVPGSSVTVAWSRKIRLPSVPGDSVREPFAGTVTSLPRQLGTVNDGTLVSVRGAPYALGPEPPGWTTSGSRPRCTTFAKRS